MPKFFVKATRFQHFKSDVIETQTEEQAVTFYKSALEGGHIEIESMEVDVDSGLEVEDEG